MGVSVIEGKVLEAPVKLKRKNLVRYAHVVFERADGGTERIAKPVATDEIAELVTPGAEGRFFLFKTIDVRGIHGVRLADGRARHAYPRNNLWAFGLAAVVSTIWIALRISTRGDIPVLGLLLLALGVVGFTLTRTNDAASQRQFDRNDEPPPEHKAATIVAPSAIE